ncbi:MAG TPA: ABC transporter permease [Gemmatimonadaceae bacterium]|nr:ABC transporter permease [Gemmatimonadaceae bacterium]
MIRPGIRRAFRLVLWRRDNVADRVDDEIALHLDLRAAQLERGGLSPADARAEAVRRFAAGGGTATARQALVQAASHRETTMHERERLAALWQDFRHSVRGIRREPAFAVLVIVTLALGIGANASMFGILDRLLLRGPEHVVDSDRIARMYQTTVVPGIGEFTGATVGYVTYADIRNGTRAFSEVAAYTGAQEMTLGHGADAEQVRVRWVTWSYFPLLRVRPVLGRFFMEAEDRPPQGEALAVLAYGAWQRVFGGDSAVIGRDVTLGGRMYAIVGIAPESFTGHAREPTDFWLPVSARVPQPTDDWATTRFAQWLEVIGRLKPGVTFDQASGEATAAHQRAYDGSVDYEAEARLSMRPLWFDGRGQEALEVSVSRWLLGVSVIVLLIACANVANLLLARAVKRRREIAVRLALGIGRARLLRLLLLEGVLLAGAGGAVGVLVALWGGQFVRATLLPNVEWSGAPVDGRMLLFTAAATMLTGILVGLLPALMASRQNLTSALKEGSRQAGSARGGVRIGLTVAQAALSMVLLVGAGLFIQSLRNVRNLDLGIEPERVLTIRPSWLASGARSPDEQESENRRRNDVRVRALERIRAHAGVESAALTIGLPFNSRFTVRLRVSGYDSLPRLSGGGPYVQAVTSDYFATVGTRRTSGRVFTPADRAGSEPVAIVSETMARTLWPGADPIGSCLFVGSDEPPCSRIVGVVRDTHRDALREDPAMQYYIPFGQERGIGGTTLLVRPRGVPMAAAESMRAEVRAADPTLGYIHVETLQERIDPQVRPWRLGATMFGIFGALALLVAAVGLYSVMSYTAAQRSHEMGVRMALGAEARDIRRLILRAGVGTAAAGVAIGAMLAWMGGRFVEELLFGTSARNGMVFGAVASCLMIVAVAASLIPARRATRVNPVVALRAE